MSGPSLSNRQYLGAVDVSVPDDNPDVGQTHRDEQTVEPSGSGMTSQLTKIRTSPPDTAAPAFFNGRAI
jgi:hypothetical protein